MKNINHSQFALLLNCLSETVYRCQIKYNEDKSYKIKFIATNGQDKRIFGIKDEIFKKKNLVDVFNSINIPIINIVDKLILDFSKLEELDESISSQSYTRYMDKTHKHIKFKFIMLSKSSLYIVMENITEKINNQIETDSLNRINSIILKSQNTNDMINDILHIMLRIFDADRAWLIYPCNPNTKNYILHFVQSRDNWKIKPGTVIDMDDESSIIIKDILKQERAVGHYTSKKPYVPKYIQEIAKVKSLLMMYIKPKLHDKWLLGIHNCEEERFWSPFEKQLFKKISVRVTDGINSLLYFRKIQEDIENMNKLESLGTLAGGLAHDFNNILTGIYGNIALAKYYLDKNHKSYNFLSLAESSMKRAKDITKQLLTFSKGGSPIKRNIRLDNLIKKIVKFDLAGSDIQANFDIGKDLWDVHADKGQLTQVISNLIINSREAMPKSGNIYISISNFEAKDKIKIEDGKYIKFVIKDTGIGIEEEALSKIFDPYFTTKENGTGLGMSMVFSIIRKHNGYIDVMSQVNKGTSFQVLLPAAETKLQINESNQTIKYNEKDQNNKYKILIMDDERGIRQIVKQMLQNEGHNIIEAKNGDIALKKYNKDIDLCIFDLTVPGSMGGIELTQKILEVNPNAYIVVSTGYSNASILSNFKKYGFKDYLEKPYTFDNLLKMLENFESQIS